MGIFGIYLSFYWVLVYSIKYFAHADHDYAQEGVGDGEPSSSCSSPCETEEYSLELTDNYPLDDEIGRKLSQMVPIPVCASSDSLLICSMICSLDFDA